MFLVLVLSFLLTKGAVNSHIRSNVISPRITVTRLRCDYAESVSPLSASASELQQRTFDQAYRIGRVLENTWTQIETLIPLTSLNYSTCRADMESAISVLVLATLRRCADTDVSSKEVVDAMFAEADTNQDGTLTFTEWFDWLNTADHRLAVDSNNNASSPSITNSSHLNESDADYFDFVLPTPSPMTSSSTTTTSGESYTNEPSHILLSLQQVFSHALFSLQVFARVNQDDPLEYVSAFIAGGIMSGVLDRNICKTMLGKLSLRNRELILFALSIESASLPSVLQSKNEALSAEDSYVYGERNDLTASVMAAEKESNLIETIDMASLPLLEAPTIFEDVEVNTALSSNQELMTSFGSTSAISISPSDTQQETELVFRRAQTLTAEISNLRNIIKDLDDSQANVMRILMLQKYGKRDDILRLAMTVRATRLQHAANLPVYARHQLAIDTLQLWAPLSFQYGVANVISELEVHSYVLLFPRSFGLFIDWYSKYRPFARALIALFGKDILSVLRISSEAQRLISSITIQSRLKTPSSAFKKMVKGAKRHHQLLDLAGIRIIVDDRDPRLEVEAVWCMYRIICDLVEWQEDKSRFKDYINSPKPSGYQSLHVSLQHRIKGLNLEVQIRSKRMHNVAEFGTASHKNYKALMLPPSTSE